MHRKVFLTIAGVIGLAIGLIALILPTVILDGKGVALHPAPAVWVREVGALIVALSVVALLVRRHPDSPTMRAVLAGNAIVHACLLPIEILAWHGGVITRLDGIVPNSILHVLLFVGFAFYAASARAEPAV